VVRAGGKTPRKGLSRRARGLVSKSKRRFTEDGFD
jgi:hypothetical protein